MMKDAARSLTAGRIRRNSFRLSRRNSTASTTSTTAPAVARRNSMPSISPSKAKAQANRVANQRRAPRDVPVHTSGKSSGLHGRARNLMATRHVNTDLNINTQSSTEDQENQWNNDPDSPLMPKAISRLLEHGVTAEDMFTPLKKNGLSMRSPVKSSHGAVNVLKDRNNLADVTALSPMSKWRAQEAEWL